MEYKGEYRIPEYYKVILVSLQPDRCKVLKGPVEEVRLAEALRDDFHSGRYEKMLQLVVREMVEESERERVFRELSLEHIQEELNGGTASLSCSYRRKAGAEMRQVSARVFPRRFGERGRVEEFMVYVSVIGK